MTKKAVATKNKPSKIKVSQLKVKQRSLEDLYELGYIKKPEGQRRFDYSMIFDYYFYKLPKEIIVTESTSIGTKLWSAKDFHNGKRKKTYNLYKIKYPTPELSDLVPLVIATDEDGIQRVFNFDSVCIVPQNHKSAKIKFNNELHEEYKEKKKEVRKEKTLKQIEQEEKEKLLLEQTSNKNIKRKTVTKRRKTRKTKKK